MPSIDEAIGSINALYGKGTAGRLSAGAVPAVEAIPSGSLALDLALGCGGYPRGRVVEIYGPESSGKSTLTLHAMASAQAQGLEVAYIDTEHALDARYAAAVGVDVDRLVLSQPDYAEQALDVAEHLVASGDLGLLVVDSVAALSPRAEVDGEMGEQTVGALARLMGRAMRKLTPALARHGTCAIFVNQIRYKVGVFFGSPETQPGGMALKFAASQRLDIRRTATNKERGDAVSNRVRVRVVKNKVGPPLREAEFDIDYGRGISVAGELADLGVASGAVTKSGSFFAFEDLKVQGRANFCRALDDDLDLRGRLAAEVREKVGATDGC